MKSIARVAFAASAALLSASSVSASLKQDQIEGCFSSTTGLTFLSTNDFNSVGSCGVDCKNANYATYAMQEKDCYCGTKLPPTSSKVDDAECNYNCPGYPTDVCGGNSLYSVYVTGLTNSVSNAAGPAGTSDGPTQSSGASSTATSSSSPSVVTRPGETVVVTASSAPVNSSTSSASAKSSGPSTAGIAAGVVVGVIVLAAIAGGVWLFMRNKNRREVEEEHQRQMAVNQIARGGKPPGSSGGSSTFTDMRLDPAVMASRRMSDGSIADNQDYSRRILKVTNA